jgi:predicted ribosomally synthesized peptide with nif11-like leader
MSEQAAQAFIERMKTDEAFRAKTKAVEDTAEHLKLIKAEGFDCSAEEIAAQLTKLDETELEAIVAGEAKSQEGVEDPWGILKYAHGYQ